MPFTEDDSLQPFITQDDFLTGSSNTAGFDNDNIRYNFFHIRY